MVKRARLEEGRKLVIIQGMAVVLAGNSTQDWEDFGAGTLTPETSVY